MKTKTLSTQFTSAREIFYWMSTLSAILLPKNVDFVCKGELFEVD